MSELKRIWADFNVGQDDRGLMRLNTNGSMMSILLNRVKSGDEVVLTDGEVEVKAVIEEILATFYGRFNWDDIRDCEE